MCRFATIISEKKIQPVELLHSFADMAKKSPAPDGDMQKDGWGIAWIDSSGTWQAHHSLTPIWDEQHRFSDIPSSHAFAIHARSASFPNHRGNILFNEPYISEKYAFVFNGILRGVTLPYPVPGNIGAEKIWNLLQKELENHDEKTALERIKTLLMKNSQSIIALNIGLLSKNTMFSLNYFTRDPSYYTLYEYKENGLHVMSSQPLVMRNKKQQFL